MGYWWHMYYIGYVGMCIIYVNTVDGVICKLAHSLCTATTSPQEKS